MSPVITGTPARIDSGGRSVSGDNPFGKVFTPRELAELWQLSEQSIRRLFQDQPGVFILGDDNPRGRRGYQTLRIPELVALRVWQERTR
jgi:hypothetical protein